MQCTPDVHYDVMYPTGKNLKESLKDRVSNKKRYLGRTQVKTPPPLASLHAGEAFCRRRRVLCSVSHSLSISVFYIVVFSSCVSVLVVSTIAISPNLLIATVFHVTLLVATASPSHLLITAQPLKANISTRSTHFVCGLVGSAHMLVLTESPLDTRPKPPLFRPFPSPVIVKVARQVPSPPKRLVSPPTPNLEPLDENLHRGFQFDRSLDRNNHIVVVGVLSLGFVESYEFRYGNSGT